MGGGTTRISSCVRNSTGGSSNCTANPMTLSAYVCDIQVALKISTRALLFPMVHLQATDAAAAGPISTPMIFVELWTLASTDSPACAQACPHFRRLRFAQPPPWPDGDHHALLSVERKAGRLLHHSKRPSDDRDPAESGAPPPIHPRERSHFTWPRRAYTNYMSKSQATVKSQPLAGHPRDTALAWRNKAWMPRSVA